MMRSGNPALQTNAFRSVPRVQAGEKAMSVQGTVNKTLILLALSFLSASWVWEHIQQAMPFIMPAVIVGLILAFATIFKKEWAGMTSPLYAIVEGVVLGGVSVMFERNFPGIVIQAVSLTFGVLFCMLMAYKMKIIQVTAKFRMGIFAATGAIALVYFISMIMGFFGARIPFIHESGPTGIIFSIFVVSIAALNLVLDFDFIEKGSEQGLPKYMEWYGAFGIMVTLIWLYMEILRLLSKTRRR